MGRRLRFYEEAGTYFVTARTLQGRYLIGNDARTAEIIGGVLARASNLFDVSIHAFAVASNHIHIVSTARDQSLSFFMRYLLGNLAKKLGRLAGWEGPLWQRRFAAEPIIGPAAEEERLRYVLSHGVKEGLVREVRDWPYLSCLGQLVGDPVRTFPFFRWSKRWGNGRMVPGGENLFAPQWKEDEKLKLTPLPSWEALSPDDRRRRVEAMVEAIDAEGRQKYPGLAGAIAGGSPIDGPSTRPMPLKKKRPQPWCHADCLEHWIAYKQRYWAFAKQFWEASRRLLGGDWLAIAIFPPRGFRPTIWAT